MRGKKGFTLVEIIVVIVLLSVIAGVFILNMTGALNRSKQNEDNETRNTVISAARAYVMSNPEKVENLYRGFSYVDIKIGELRDEGYLQEDLKSASTGEIIPDGKIVRITYNPDTDEIKYDFIEEGEAVELTRYDLVAEPISLKHNQNATGNWCDQNYKYGYYEPNTDSKMYFVDKDNNEVTNPEEKITLTPTENCDVDLTRIGKYKIEYKYTYTDNGETITSTKIRNVYVVPDQFNITYEENADGVTNMPNPKKLDIVWSQEYTFPSNVPQRRGYTFLGWSQKSSAVLPEYKANETVIFKPIATSNDVTLYAIWKINTYTITVNVDGGTSDPTSRVIEYLGEKTYQITPDSIHRLLGATVTCTTQANPSLNETTGVLTINNIYGNDTCTVKLPLSLFDVKVVVNSGSASPSTQKIRVDSTGTYTISPSTNYILSNPTITCSGGASGSMSGDKLTISNVTSHQTCTVKLKEYYCPVGTLSGTSCIANASNQGWTTQSSYKCGCDYQPYNCSYYECNCSNHKYCWYEDCNCTGGGSSFSSSCFKDCQSAIGDCSSSYAQGCIGSYDVTCTNACTTEEPETCSRCKECDYEYSCETCESCSYREVNCSTCYETVYYCPSGWSNYSGSGTSLQCSKTASLR